MPRPYIIMEKPVMTPYVCIQCGLGAGAREWFVDLGFTVDQYFDVNNQAIYLCNECYNAMTLDIGRLVRTFRRDHEKFSVTETPTYTWMEQQNDVRESESGDKDSGVADDEFINATDDPSTSGDNQDTEPDDSEPESTDSGDANSTDDSDSDESTGFTVKFGT